MSVPQIGSNSIIFGSNPNKKNNLNQVDSSVIKALGFNPSKVNITPGFASREAFTALIRE